MSSFWGNTGGLFQLVAMGSQDMYITGNPEITAFKTIYGHHRIFSKRDESYNESDELIMDIDEYDGYNYQLKSDYDILNDENIYLEIVI